MLKKILLVTPGFEGISQNQIAETDELIHYPMGLAYLHSYLESKEYSVKTLSLNHKPYNICLEEITKAIEDFSPDAVGFQVLTANRGSVYNLVDHMSKNFPKMKIFLGGIHATVMYEQLIKRLPSVIVVLGEGEITTDELLKELSKKNPVLKKIDGIAYFDKKLKKPIRTKRRDPIKDLDSIPFPNHDQFLIDKRRNSACLLTSRGCPFACSFCCLNPESKRMVRFRSVENVVDEIEYIDKKFPHIKEIFIHDDTFFVNNRRVIDICKEILKRGIKKEFVCSGRMKPISEEMVKALEKAGFTRVLLGLESGDEHILKNCHKGIVPQDAINAFKLFSKSQIHLIVFLIVGLPGETKKSIRNTINLVRKLQRIKYFMFGKNGFNLLTIYPGTEVYEIAKRKGFVEDSYWLTDKETPIYTAENSYEKLTEFKKELANSLSFYRIFTKEGFIPQIKMAPYALRYFFKKKKNWKLIKHALKSFLK